MYMAIAEILAKQTQSCKRTKSVYFYLKKKKKKERRGKKRERACDRDIEQERMHENPLYYCVNMAKGGLTSKRNTAPSTTITITTKTIHITTTYIFCRHENYTANQNWSEYFNNSKFKSIRLIDWWKEIARDRDRERGRGRRDRELGKEWTMTKCETSSIPIELKWMPHLRYIQSVFQYVGVCVCVRCFFKPVGRKWKWRQE